MAAVKNPFNGDGVIEARSIDEYAADDGELANRLRGVLRDMIDASGGTVGVSSELGVDAKRVDAFFDALTQQAKAIGEVNRDALLLGDDTASAYSVVSAVEKRIDDFFERCRVVAYTGSSDIDEHRSVASTDTDALRELPIARPTPSGVLPLHTGINPVDRDNVERLAKHVLAPLELRHDVLGETEWRHVKRLFAPYAAFHAALAANPTSSLPLSRVHELLQSDAREHFGALLERDAAAKPRVAALHSVEQLVHAWCHLSDLMRNFVSFEQFADKRTSSFQVGHVVLDGRRADLVLPVESEERVLDHAELATKSNCFLVYLRCTKKDQSRIVVAVFTSGYRYSFAALICVISFFNI